MSRNKSVYWKSLAETERGSMCLKGKIKLWGGGGGGVSDFKGRKDVPEICLQVPVAN